MINTLNVASQGYLPDKTSLSAATLGWLGTTLNAFIENNEFVWLLNAKDDSWNLINQNTAWFLNQHNIEWTVDAQVEHWNTRPHRIKWTVSFDD